MSRLRLRAGLLLLALLLAGIAGDAGATLAAGTCCAGMPADPAASEEAPCRSLAPTSCCEASATGRAPAPPVAPAAPAAAASPVPAVDALPSAWIAPLAVAPARIALATIVLRL